MNLQLTAPNLWASAHAMLKQLFFLISGTTPAHLQSLKPRERKQLREWLAALEAMVRKILLIEAAALGPPASPPASSKRAQCNAFARRHAGEDAGGPSKRAPSFILIPTNARQPQHPARIRMLGAPTSLAELLREKARAQRIAALRAAPPAGAQSHLANRISAIARVITNPHTAIRALARRLRKSKQIGYAIVTARVRTPLDFHGDAKLTADRDAFNALAKCNSS